MELLGEAGNNLDGSESAAKIAEMCKARPIYEVYTSKYDGLKQKRVVGYE